MKDNHVSRSLEAVALRAVPDNTDLWPRISTRLEERRSLLPVARRRSLWAAIILILIILLLAGTVYAIGNLLVYIPGIGFTEAAKAYVLPSPVVETQSGVTLHVEQVLAAADRTVLVLYIDGLTPEEQRPYLYNSFLLLPDGKVLVHRSLGVDWKQTTLVFGPLPEGVSRVNLVWSDGSANQPQPIWSLPLVLEPARNSDSLKMASSYALKNADLIYQDRIIRVTDVSQDMDRTAIRLELLWPVESEDGPFYIDQATLEDNLGTRYELLNESLWDEQGQTIGTEVLESPMRREYQSIFQTLIFRQGNPAAHGFILTLDRITCRERVDTDFVLDLGNSPRAGDRLPLNIQFNLAGGPLHINSAQVVETDIYDLGQILGKRPALEFVLDPLPMSEQRIVTWVNFRSPQISQDLLAGYTLDPATGIEVLRLPLVEIGGGKIFGTVHVLGDWAEVLLPVKLTIPWNAPEP